MKKYYNAPDAELLKLTLTAAVTESLPESEDTDPELPIIPFSGGKDSYTF